MDITSGHKRHLAACVIWLSFLFAVLSSEVTLAETTFPAGIERFSINDRAYRTDTTSSEKPQPIKTVSVSLPQPLRLENKVAQTSVFFSRYRDGNNVTNAGVAGGYINGLHLPPGRLFSFNQTVGPRTKEKGFIIGHNIHNKPVRGGGVCRMSTVLYQLAKKAGFTIIERHSHSKPVDYVPPGQDAAVDYGSADLKFRNNTACDMVIYAGLQEGKKGRLLWAELYELKPLVKCDLIVLRRPPGRPVWEDVEPQRLTALLLDGSSYISLEQLGGALGWKVGAAQTDGRYTATADTGGMKAVFTGGSKKAVVNGHNAELKNAPFVLNNSNCRFWVPLKEIAQLIQAEVVWEPRTRVVILNPGSAGVEGRTAINREG
ncbi:MAG: VanW family protein [Bacillota bacterium]